MSLFAVCQEQLAELADLNIRTVQEIEAGALNILLTTLIRLRNALDCPRHELLG
jgi:transcriptional regulator with XRE-family HTH domain